MRERERELGKRIFRDFRSWQTQLYEELGAVDRDVLCLILADLVHTIEVIDAELTGHDEAADVGMRRP